MGMTAERPAADSDSAKNFRLITHPNLAQLDSSLKHRSQIFYQLPKVNTAVCRKIKQHFIIVKRILRINQLHVKIMLLNLLQTNLKRIFLLLFIGSLLLDITSRRHAQHRF